MKTNRSCEIAKACSNLKLIVDDIDRNIVAFATDTDKFDITNLVCEFATNYALSGKKVLVVTYDDETNFDGVDALCIAPNNDDASVVESKAKEYDLVLVICPNMISSNVYLHVATYAKDIVFVAKKWKSKIANIKEMKALVQSKDMNILGLIYEK